MGICASVPSKPQPSKVVAKQPLEVPESKPLTIRKPEDILEPRESLTSIEDTLTRVESKILTTEACMVALVVLIVGVTYVNVFRIVNTDIAN